MNIVTVLRRSFAANPHKAPVAVRESEVLEARGIRDPVLQTYFAWRRSLLLFVVLSTLVSAGLATYRELYEEEVPTDLLTTINEKFPLLDALQPEEEEEEEDDAAMTTAAEAEPVEEKNAFEQFTDAVELFALYALPLAALAAVVVWTRFRLSFRLIVAAFLFSFLMPMLIGLCPWSWFGHEEREFDPKTQTAEYLQDKAEGLSEGAQYLGGLLPTVLSLIPGVQRACIRVKFLLPQSLLPGWFLVTASPFYALFLFVIFVAINQFDTHPLFFVGMLLFLAAPLIYCLNTGLFTRPIATADDERRIRLYQRVVGLISLVGIGLITAFLATREFLGIRLLGPHYDHALLVPLDVVEFLLETLARSMFITVLGADLFMRMNLSAWQQTRAFAGTEAAAQYDHVLGEFEKLA